METVENKYITVAYKLYAIEDGEKDFTEEATAEHPFQFISGLGLILESFEDQVKSLKAGDKFDFTIACADAYGDFDEEHVIDLPKQIFEVDGKFDSERIVSLVWWAAVDAVAVAIAVVTVAATDAAITKDADAIIKIVINGKWLVISMLTTYR